MAVTAASLARQLQFLLCCRVCGNEAPDAPLARLCGLLYEAAQGGGRGRLLQQQTGLLLQLQLRMLITLQHVWLRQLLHTRAGLGAEAVATKLRRWLLHGSTASISTASVNADWAAVAGLVVLLCCWG